MKSYTLTLISGTNYTISLDGTPLTTAEFEALFMTNAGTAQFVADIGNNTFTIWDSSAMSGNSISSTEEITTASPYEGTWAVAEAGATTNTFTSFVVAEGVAMTRFQLSDLMGKVKSAAESGSIPTYEVAPSSNDQTVLLGTAYTAVGNEKCFIVRNIGTSNRMILRPNTSVNGVVVAASASVLVVVTANASVADSIYPSQAAQGLSYIVYGQGGDSTSSGRFGPTVFYSSSGKWFGRQLPTTAVHYPFNATIDLTAINGPMSVVSSTAGVLIGQLVLGTYTGSYGGYSYPLMSTAATWTTIGTSSQYTKRALQVTVNIKETSLTLTANDWNTLFTLPTNFYPDSEIVTGCTMTDNGTIVNGLVKITTAGLVQVMAGSNTTEVYGLLTIPVAS